MKISVFRSSLLFCCLLIAHYLLTGCNNNIDCQSPPAQIAIQITNGTLTYPADLDTAARIKVSYQENNQQKYVGDLIRMGDVFISYMLVEDSRRLNDPEFSFELNGQVLAKMKMETYLNNAKCNGWANISKVYQNGETISRSANGTYLLK